MKWVTQRIVITLIQSILIQRLSKSKLQNMKIGLFNDKSLTTRNALNVERVIKITPAVVAIIPTMGTGEGRPRIGPQTR